MQFKIAKRYVFFLILVINVLYSNCQSSFFMVHNLKKNEYYCITNSTHALSWLADDEGTQESERKSQFIPHAPLFRLGIEGESKWIYVVSYTGTILDRRWETIPTYKTVTEKYSRLQFINVEEKLQQNFQISLSIRISREAHIFLCDGDKVEESNCYWFLLMGFRGNKTELRKCAEGTIPVLSNIAVPKSCETPIQTIMHNNSDSRYLTNKEWRHFELSKKDNKLSFKRLNNKDAIIQYDDGEKAYSITHMMIHSKNSVTALWKIHKVPYLYTNYSTNQKTTVEISPKNGVICLSLFVKMCSNCKITLTLSEINNETNILKEETYSSQEKWKEIKLFVDNVQTNATLFISTITNNQRDVFWNIDPHIRECNNTEHRMIKSTQKLKCQLISKEDHDVISFDDDAKPTVPGEIRGLTITDIRDSSVRLKWQSPESFNGQFVKYVVTYQLVSHKSCKTSNGITFPIKQLSAEETDVTVSGLVPYAKYSFSVSAWNREVGGPPVTVIQNTFASDTISDTEIPKFNMKIEAHSVKLYFSSMDCSIVRGPLQIKIKKRCSNKWCVNNVEQETECDFENTSCLVPVIPYSDYTFYIKFCRNSTCAKTVQDSFQTMSEPPNVVRDLRIFSKNENSISIRWMPPYPPTGNLDLYKISYKEADTNNKEEMETLKDLPCTLWSEYQCFTLSKLEKRKNYSIKVQAINENPNIPGQITTVGGTTKIEPSKEPHNLTIHWNLQNDLELTWGHPNETSGLITFFNISVISHKSVKINLYDSFPVTHYKPFYQYKIEEKRLLKSVPFRIRIGAFNGYNGTELAKDDTSPPARPLFTTDPIISTSNDTITIEISPIKSTNRNDKNKYELFLFLLDENFNNHDNVKSLTRLRENHHVNLSKFKILYQCQLKSPVHFKIGQDNYTINDCNRTSSSYLKPATTYNVTILLTNTFMNKTSYKLYSYPVHTLGEPVDVPQDLSLLALLSLLLIIPIAIILFIKRGPLIENYNSLKTSMCQRTCLETSTPDEQTPLKNIAPENTKLYSKKVKIAELEQYVTESLNNGELERQHALFPRGQTKPWERGALKENKSKNRYTNLMAYDHTRVVLQWINGNKNSDYINANYIDGYNVRKAYIATQGPKISTVHDFWRMIWQENVLHVAMLANIYEGKKKKVEKYWPDQNENLSFGDITVYHMSGQVFADYEQRTFKVCFNNQTRKLQQYHFSSWPDHGVPLYSQSLVPFLQKIQQIPLDSKSPVVVHCSAGVGRTGTILLCDICLRMAAKEDAVDMLRTLQQLRDQRANMVDNIQQYKLAHLVILECLVGKQTGIPCSEIETEVKKLLSGDRITQQMRYLKDTAWQDKTMKSVASNDAFVVVQEKNRFQNIVPEIQGCMFLSRYPIHDDTSTYINAVRVDGFRCPGRFIVTQQPMPNTLGDFWRLVHEKETTVIVSLNPVNPKNKTSCLFWPTEKQPELTPVEYITLKHATTLSLDSYNLTTIRMHINASEEYTVVQIISMKDWPAKKNCPKKIEDFLTFCEESYVISRQSSSVVVTCFDGVLASGVYVAMSFVIEKMKLEQICDVCQAVRTVRHNRNEFVQNEEQFAFLYKAAEAYITGFQFYANFS